MCDPAAFARADDGAARRSARARAMAPRVNHRGAENMAKLQHQSDTYGAWMTDLAQNNTSDPLASDREGTEFRQLWKMLRDGQSANTVGGFGETPLLRCQGQGLWVVLLLLRFGADPNFRCEMWDSSYGGTALHMAAKGGQVGPVVCLLNAGANPALLDREGFTPAAAALADDASDGRSKAASAITRFVIGRGCLVDIHAGSLEQAHAAVLAAVEDLQ